MNSRGEGQNLSFSVAKIPITSVMLALLATTMATTTTIVEPSIAYAQVGTFPIRPADQIIPTYIVSIVPGAAFPGSIFHYYPQDIAVPAGTIVAWFNDDPGRLHTVTSGAPDDTANSGTFFNSGLLPLGSSFHYSFDEPGTFEYFCAVHPWMTSTVTVSDASERGSNFELRSGTDPTLDLSQHNRTVLEFRPITFSPQVDPIIYNVSLLAPDTQETIFSESFITISQFVRANNYLYIELINDATIERISVYGPDVWDPLTGTYHVAGDLFERDGEYTIKVQATSIGETQPADRIEDEFRLQVVEETQTLLPLSQ
jgi:plastocyanin